MKKILISFASLFIMLAAANAQQTVCCTDEMVQKAREYEPEALLSLSKCYYEGNGVEKNIHKAISSALLAIGMGNGEAREYRNFLLTRLVPSGSGQTAADSLECALQKDDTGALLSYGYYLYKTDKNKALGKRYLTIAAEKGCESAQMIIASDMLGREDIKDFPDNLLTMIESLTSRGNPLGLLMQASRLIIEKPTKEKFAEAVHMAEQSYAHNCRIASKFIIIMYQNAPAEYKDESLLTGWMQELVKKGDSDMMYQLAGYYQNGIHFEENSEKYILWLTRAASAGNTDAATSLAYEYYKGNTVGLNYDKALDYYYQAAVAGNTEAMDMMGVMFQNGYGVTANMNKAVEWWSRSAEAGSAPSAYRLAICYTDGIFVKADDETAVRYLKAAADQDFTPAVTRLALSYVLGEGVEKDYARAHAMCIKSANNGDAKAVEILYVMYRDGIGVRADDKRASLLWDTYQAMEDENWVKAFNTMKKALKGLEQ